MNPTFVKLTKQRLTVELDERNISIEKQEILEGDARIELRKLKDETIDFVVTSPPYWTILKKQDHKVRQERLANNLSTDYGDDPRDLGQIDNYCEFLQELTQNIRGMQASAKDREIHGDNC